MSKIKIKKLLKKKDNFFLKQTKKDKRQIK